MTTIHFPILQQTPPVLLLLLLLATLTTHTKAFQSSSFLPSRHNQLAVRTTANRVLLYSTQKERQQQQEEELSEVDARVLREMLQSEKLDLQTEESLKNLLERGVTSKQVPKVPKGQETDSEFSSRLLQTLGDTKLWQAFQRKAGDWLESAKLYVQNRVERDAVTLAALGLFAWERAIKDVGRALPAASSFGTSKDEKKQFLLSEKSSFVTPMDEFKSVSQSVSEILRTGGEAQTSTTLRTAATSRQDKRNFQRSYQKSTQNKPSFRKAASTVTDTAWQVQRELQVEQNSPGYKSKQVQTALQAAQNSTRQLLQGAQEQWKLERAKTKQKWLLNENDAVQEQEKPQPQDYFEVKADEVISLKDESTQEDHSYSSATAFDTIEDEPTATIPQGSTHEQPQQNPYLSTIELEAQRRQAQMQTDRQEYEQLRKEQERLRRIQQKMEFQPLLQAECVRLKDELQNCIGNPEETWLRPDIVQGIESFDPDRIRAVVTQMINTRNQLKEILSLQESDASGMPQAIIVREQLEELQGMVQEAVSSKSASVLQELLLPQTEEEEDLRTTGSVFLRLEEWNLLWEEAEQTQQVEEPVPEGEENSDFFYAAPVEEELDDFESQSAEYNDSSSASMSSNGEALEPEVMDIIPEAFVAAVATMPTQGTSSTQAQVSSMSTMVELVTDDDFEAAVGETKSAVAADDDDEKSVAKEKDEENLVVTLLLRLLDIIFLLLEKTFTIALPALITGSGTAKERLDDIARGGLGSEGWKRIGNARAGSQRY